MGRAWAHLNNIALGQFYEVAFDFQKPYHVCGGLQDNYSWCGPSSSAQQLGIGNEDWISVQGGDGFYNRIDPSDPNIIYAEAQDGNLFRRDLRSSESKSIRPREPNDQAPRYRFQWNSPLIISPHDPKTIYYGGNHLFKSTDRGDTWEVLGEDLTTGADREKQKIFGIQPDEHTLSRNDGVVAWPCITTIAESPTKPGVLWVGTDDGLVQMTRDGGKTWSNVSGRIMGLPKGGYVSRIEPSRKDPATAYITYDNHRSADYAIYIYATHNYGDSFAKLTNGIPPEAGTVHVIREDPFNQDLLFAGTEFGLFLSFDRGANWRRMTNGLPTVPVFDVQIHPRDHDLILATHGRSIWIMDDINALEQMNSEALSSDLKLFDSRPAVEWKIADYRGFIGSSLFYAPNAPNGVLLDYYAKKSGLVHVTISDKTGHSVRQFDARANAGEVTRTAWDLRSDPPVPLEPSTPERRAASERDPRGAGERPTETVGLETARRPEAGSGGEEGGGGELQKEFGVTPPEGGPVRTGGGGFGRTLPPGRGPWAEPGTYTVAVSMGGKTESKNVTVEEDPRVQVAAADREKRRQTIDTLVQLSREADAGRKKAVSIQTGLTRLVTSWKAPDAPKVPDAVKRNADELLAKSKKVTDRFQPPAGPRGGAGPGRPYTPPAVTVKISALLGAIDSYSGAPTRAQLNEAQEASTQLQKDLAELTQLTSDLPKLNKAISDAGVPYFNSGN